MVKVLRGTPKHLSNTGQLDGFVYLMLTLPFKCNYRCPKCFNLINDKPVTTGEPMTLAETFLCIDEAKPLGGKVVVIAGEGEPTLDGNIREIVSRIAELEMIPIVYSNGSSLTTEMSQFYHDQNACLVIAVDSLEDDLYRYLTGTKRDMLPTVQKNLSVLRQIYADTVEERDGLQIVRLALNMTLVSGNKQEIEKIKAFAGDDMYFVCNPLAREGNAVGNWQRLVATDDDPAETNQLIQLHSESGGPLTLDSAGICGYSINGIGIGPYGHYMTCAYTIRTNGLLGTVRDRSLKDAYQLKTKIERRHYATHGVVPCLVRAPSFDDFLISLDPT